MAEAFHDIKVMQGPLDSSTEVHLLPRGQLRRSCTGRLHCAHVADAPVDPASQLLLVVRYEHQATHGGTVLPAGAMLCYALLA